MSGRQIFSESEKFCLQELIIKYKIHSITTIGAGNPAIKKTAWARLTEEYNSIETNCRRTEAQLKKCWDNLKTRKKHELALQKRERIRTGGGPYMPASTSTSHEVIEEALADCTDVELHGVIDSDFNRQNVDEAMPDDAMEEIETEFLIPPPHDSQRERRESASSLQPEMVREETTPGPSRIAARPGSRILDYGNLNQGRNVRARVITEEFGLRRENYQRAQEREEELHRLKMEEREWLAKTAQELYKKAVLERENAEEVLRCSRAKREEAEIMLGIRKNKFSQ
ncbi:myb/SANT-like DNA-binding domain-containing protein 3 [Plutella xylostella]|nr:myb/SANT-like DNA-binding domain-containing protein 3 [Plutella xylostella]